MSSLTSGVGKTVQDGGEGVKNTAGSTGNAVGDKLPEAAGGNKK